MSCRVKKMRIVGSCFCVVEFLSLKFNVYRMKFRRANTLAHYCSAPNGQQVQLSAFFLHNRTNIGPAQENLEHSSHLSAPQITTVHQTAQLIRFSAAHVAGICPPRQWHQYTVALLTTPHWVIRISLPNISPLLS